MKSPVPSATIRLMPLVFATILSACSTTQSTNQFREGSQALERGDVALAISALQEAVRIDPNNASAYTNLAAAYARVGRMQDAWVSTRAALLLDLSLKEAHLNFDKIWRRWEAQGLFRAGTSKAELAEVLGTPDFEIGVKDGSDEMWIYGIKVLRFRFGELVAVEAFGEKSLK
jgi:tetratricopeptide (TPR) repeat protein